MAVRCGRESTIFVSSPLESSALRRFGRLRSLVLVDPMDAISRPQLARALVLSGETAKAKNAYNDLCALWEEADPKIPMVNAARAEYAKLQ